ncbi:unnamed protein product [Vicia faba]|uniref:Uncharacterized protein n=1 Tax=Vicia faba TaxID=3906 RepID=A0AAV1AQA9_VICFA|nr:unnamed protein product [Vicia faba]
MLLQPINSAEDYCSTLKLNIDDTPPTRYMSGILDYYCHNGVTSDDLVISPLSPISALGSHDRFKTPLDDVKEQIVTIGVKECLNILKATLTSTSALTNGLAHLLTGIKEEK